MRARESLDCGVPAGLLLVESMAPSSSSPDRRSSQFRLPPPRSSEATLDFGPRRRWWRGGGVVVVQGSWEVSKTAYVPIRRSTHSCWFLPLSFLGSDAGGDRN